MKDHIRLSILLVFILTLNAFSQKKVTVSGYVNDNEEPLPYVNVVIKKDQDSSFVSGTITDLEGHYELTNIAPGDYQIEFSFVGYKTNRESLFVGTVSDYLLLKPIALKSDLNALEQVTVTAKQNMVSWKMNKKTFSTNDNISQSGGSVLQALQNLPGITTQEGKIQLRGSENVTILIDGKQTALTGFGGQKSLDNLPSSSIEKIEIINSPSAKYDTSGSAGIINIIYKKNKQNGFNGKAGVTFGVGALWERKENLPTITPQYQQTPKINPSIVLNYKKNKINSFLEADYLYKETLNKNEFVTRVYDDEENTVVHQQSKRNRDTGLSTFKTGFDYNIDTSNTFSFSAFYSSEVIIDNGEEPFYNEDYSERLRLWTFLEDEVKTTAIANATYEHKFKEAGHKINIGFNYNFHREDEKYFFNNTVPNEPESKNSFKLLSDESVYDVTFDYTKPLKHGILESGIKFRRRNIPTNMEFYPDPDNPLVDPNDGGPATYTETIPAIYANYRYEDKKYLAEVGVRVEYVKLDYEVNPDHNVYESNGYQYAQPFPNINLARKINANNRVSFLYNRRVDRPTELQIRIFPKYDDAELIKVGNPDLKPQFTDAFELGYKSNWNNGYFYGAGYHKITEGTITRIATTDPIEPSNNLIYTVYHNADKSYNTGVELIVAQKFFPWYNFNINTNIYHNKIDAFSVENLYPNPSTVSVEAQKIFSGNFKTNHLFNFSETLEGQLSTTYLGADIIPQGKIKSRFSLDIGLKKTIQNGKGEIVFNASDLLNTLVVRKEIQGETFYYTSEDYKETQVFRLGYSYKF